jgi:hypothetical protein
MGKKRGQNEGSWRQLPSGKWHFRVMVSSEDGRKSRRSFSGATKAECRRQAAAAQAEASDAAEPAHTAASPKVD